MPHPLLAITLFPPQEADILKSVSCSDFFIFSLPAHSLQTLLQSFYLNHSSKTISPSISLDQWTLCSLHFTRLLSSILHSTIFTLCLETVLNLFFFLFLFFFFCLFRSCTHGSSQGRGPIGAAAAGLYQSHSNSGSELCLRPTLQLTAMPDP